MTLLLGSPRGRSSDVNSNSLVLLLRYGDVRVLLAGDVEEEAERLLLDRRADLKAHVLKVPHHGGRTSSTLAFLERVCPRIAIVSAGHRNRFRHPHHETLERYRSLGSDLLRTDRDGAVTLTTDGVDIEVATVRGIASESPVRLAPPRLSCLSRAARQRGAGRGMIGVGASMSADATE
jgi:competence protein ComEC